MKITLLVATLLVGFGLQPTYADSHGHHSAAAPAAAVAPAAAPLTAHSGGVHMGMSRSGGSRISGQHRPAFRPGAAFPRSPGQGITANRGVHRPIGTYRGSQSDRHFTVDRSSHHGWDRRRDHFSGHRRYHWSGSSWVIYGLGYPYGYGYAGYDAYPEYVQRASIEQQVQARLANEGYYRGSIDGAVGPVTRRAIARYQRDHGLAANGRINGSLLDALDLS